MPLSTEVFVMTIFIAGAPFFYFILKDSGITGRGYFTGAYALLTASNIFTVVEEFGFNTFFNMCEHLSITLSSALLFAGVMSLTKGRPETISGSSGTVKG